jgi:hypothetical protein
MKKYEYKTETFYHNSSDEVEVWLNEQGQEGWRLVKTTQMYGSDFEEYLFEREITPNN